MKPPGAKETLLLIDANSLIHRSYHALPLLTARDGTPSQALYGVGSVLLKVLREERPRYAAACFDRPEPTFREKEYPAYKAQRPPAPEPLVTQIIAARDLFRAFGVRTFELPGFEADDLIATVARRFGDDEGVRVLILTGDLDTLQLVKPGVEVKAFKRGVSDTVVYDRVAVENRYGVGPEKLADYKALVGDQSDNIKGVPGVGPKTAAELLTKFKDLEDIYAHLSATAGRTREALEAARTQAFHARKLVTLTGDAPLPLQGVNELEVERNAARMKDYFAALGFTSLVKRIEQEGASPASEEKNPARSKRKPPNAARLF